jgi:outer membrane lipoprotein SlyB
MQHVPGSASVVLVLTLLAACSPQQQASPDASPAAVAVPAVVVVERAAVPAPIVCSSCGVVRSITAVSHEGKTTGAGAVIGGIVGGVAGNQVGGGSGRQIATVAGVIGGAVLGNKVEQNRSASSWYEIVIDMEGGGQEFITVEDPGSISAGSRVTVQGNTITQR